MKRILFYILSLIILVSCGKNNKVKDNQINFWHFWSEPSQKKELQKIINIYQNETGIEVKTTELSWNDGKTKLFTAFNSGIGPDALELGSDWVSQFSSSGVLSQIPDSLAKMESYLDFAKAPSFWNNKIYALPWLVDTRMLFVNKDLFSESPDSWEEILDTLINKKFNYDEKSGIYLIGQNGPDANRLYKKIISFIWSAGGDISDFDSEENIYALEMYKKLADQGIVEKQRNLDELFLKGKLGMIISGGWLVSKLQNSNINYQVKEMPTLNDHRGVSFAGGEYLAINNGSKKKELALKFIKYMTKGENALAFCKLISDAGFPADKEFYNDPFFEQNDTKKKFSKQLESAKMTPVHKHWFEIQDALELATERVLYHKMSAKEALEKTKESTKSLINK
jgi:multiple sugar transport system substrate-binding protein